MFAEISAQLCTQMPLSCANRRRSPRDAQDPRAGGRGGFDGGFPARAAKYGVKGGSAWGVGAWGAWGADEPRGVVSFRRVRP